MKRQRNQATTAASNKKAKGEVETKVEEEEERRDVRECFVVAAEAEMLEDWEEWRRLWSVVDEQMSWGSFWCPFWDIEEWFGEDYNAALYSDVVWDDDIWDLKSIKEVPNP